MRIALILSLALAGTMEAPAAHHQSAKMEVLIDGVPATEYRHQGTVYLEAIRGKEYAVRLTNPTGSRVAVALSVDGLNTIDARHTDARAGRKWVLDAYESVVISGWQTNAQQARRFFFTTEQRSYGAWLGRTENLGIISAAFFKEKIYRAQRPAYEPHADSRLGPEGSPAAPQFKSEAESTRAAGRFSDHKEAQGASVNDRPEYAATGIGDRMHHEVQWVQMELEDRPFASVNIRYEFRPALARLGIVLPGAADDPLSRREKAKGFRDPLYCPEP